MIKYYNSIQTLLTESVKEAYDLQYLAKDIAHELQFTLREFNKALPILYTAYADLVLKDPDVEYHIPDGYEVGHSYSISPKNYLQHLPSLKGWLQFLDSKNLTIKVSFETLTDTDVEGGYRGTNISGYGFIVLNINADTFLESFFGDPLLPSSEWTLDRFNDSLVANYSKTLVHELQHAFDHWRQGSRMYTGYRDPEFKRLGELIRNTPRGQAVDPVVLSSFLKYYNMLPPEVWARVQEKFLELADSLSDEMVVLLTYGNPQTKQGFANSFINELFSPFEDEVPTDLRRRLYKTFSQYLHQRLEEAQSFTDDPTFIKSLKKTFSPKMTSYKSTFPN